MVGTEQLSVKLKLPPLFSQENGVRRVERTVEPRSSTLQGASEDNGTGSARMLVLCIAGIYVTFLTRAVLEERITTTPYGPEAATDKFRYPVFANTVQSILAAISGLVYLSATTPAGRNTASIFPTRTILFPLLLVSLTNALASPFGYASLQYVDFITLILAKSCKLLPVMALQTTIFRKKYPFYKYLVVCMVTLGVAVFTLHHPSNQLKAAKHKKSSIVVATQAQTLLSSIKENKTAWGLTLLGINLLFDGLFNSTQDYIFATFKPYSAPQMMCAQNILSTLITCGYLLVTPMLAGTWIGELLTLPPGDQLREAIRFIGVHPKAGRDVILFGICGAIGQVFIFQTLATFSSLLLVTVNVTRKMLTMVVSVVWFGHHLSQMQWLGVGLVFGGIGGEAWMNKREKEAKTAARRRQQDEKRK